MTYPVLNRRFRIFSIATCIVFATIHSPALAGPPPAQVVSERVQRRIAQNPSGREVLWIFFNDKGFASAAEERRAIESLPGPVSVRPARRHAPDARDLPVAIRYIESVKGQGALIRHLSRWLNAVSVEMDLAGVPAISALPFVRGIDIVRRSRRQADPLDSPAYSPEPNDRGGSLRPEGSTGTASATTSYPAEELLHYGASMNQNKQIGILALHRLGYTGAGVKLAMFDTGFRTDHPVFAGRHVIATRDFVFHDSNVNNEAVDWSTAWNHGTSTWSNAAGLKAGALVGGAYEASIILAKTEDIRSETPIEEDNYVAALEWADSLGVDIVSASLAYLDFDGTVDDYTYADMDGNTAVTTIAVDIAVSRGIAVVNAMGNSGSGAGTLNAPADADSVIAIGAVDSLGIVANFSSRGPTYDGRIKPEVVARGVRNFIALAAGGFGSGSGTSFATPVTAGAATLLLEAHPEWNGFQLRQALMNTASHPGLPDNNTGWGLVNALQAANLSPRTPPHVSLPFALIAPSRGAELATAVPTLRWERSLPSTPGDVVNYRMILSNSATLAPADTFSAGQDTTWSPSFYLTPGSTYYWTVQAVNTAGWKRAAYMPSSFTIVSTVDAGPYLPPPASQARLIAARPNPVSATTRIGFSLPELRGADALESYTINVYSAQGRLVRSLVRDNWGPGARVAEVDWNRLDDSGVRAAAGIYFVNLDALGLRSTLKVVLSR